MKKRLLFAALAMSFAIGSFAYEDGDYAYTKNGRVKVTGENLVTNGDFANELKDWTGATEESPNSDAWGLQPGVGANGENAAISKGAQSDETDNALCQVIQLTPGTYVASFQIQASGETTSGATSVGTTINANYADIFLNTDGAKTRAAGTEEAPVGAVATSVNFNGNWTTANFFFEVADTTNAPTFLVIRFEKLATDVQITNVSVNTADEVYDIRIAQQKIAWARTAIEIPEFNTSDAAGKRNELLESIGGIESMMEAGELDVISQAEAIIPQLDVAIGEFLDCSSKNLKEQLKGIDISTLGYAGRGRTITGLGSAEAGGVWLEGGSWGHLNPADGEEEYLMSAIQTGYDHTAKYCVANSTLPAGKYFFTAEIRNARTTKTSWPCDDRVYDLETTCQISIGDVTQDIENVVGEAYQRVYLIADVAADGGFTASLYWPGNGSGGAFFVRNPEVRTFEMDAEEKAAHVAAFTDFLVQYNAAVSARNTIISMQSDKNYPWNKQALQEALDTYDPYFHITDGWVTANGEDAGVATTDQLNSWAKYQGGEVPEDEKATYYVVRGYQAAINTVKTDNKAISDLNAEISRAYEVSADGMFSNGDKPALMLAITEAQNTLKTVLSDADDSSKDADEATLAEALATLTAAIETFKESGSISPIVDIDFSNPVQTETNVEDGTDIYVIKGAKGQMNFTVFQTDNSINDYSFALGVDVNGETQLGDVLHVGGDSYGEAVLPEAAGDGEALRIFFDLWFGQLGSAYQYVDLVNADGERVAGFSIDSYRSVVEYNEFDNEEGTGMVIKGKIKSNHDKNGGAASVCTEALTNAFDLTVNYKAGTVNGTLTNSSNKVVGIEIPIRTDLADNKIAAFRIGGRGHAKANAGAFGRRAWFDNLKIYKYPAGGVTGDVNGDTFVDVADISMVITIMAAGTNDKAGDVNGDGEVDVADISAIITIMANN